MRKQKVQEKRIHTHTHACTDLYIHLYACAHTSVEFMIIVYIFGILYDLIMQFQPLQTAKTTTTTEFVLRSALCSWFSLHSASHVCLYAALYTYFLQHFKGFATAAATTTTTTITTTLSIRCYYYLLWPKSNPNLRRAVEDECTFVYK